MVSACGFDSIPSDVGLEMLREKFPGTLTKAESFIHFDSKKLKGGANYGTYLTIIHSVANFSEFRKQQKQVFQYCWKPFLILLFLTSQWSKKYNIDC